MSLFEMPKCPHGTDIGCCFICQPRLARMELVEAVAKRQKDCQHGMKGDHRSCISCVYEAAISKLVNILPPLVIRTAGEGKGVVITRTDAEAVAAIKDCLAHGPNQTVTIERLTTHRRGYLGTTADGGVDDADR